MDEKDNENNLKWLDIWWWEKLWNSAICSTIKLGERLYDLKLAKDLMMRKSCEILQFFLQARLVKNSMNTNSTQYAVTVVWKWIIKRGVSLVCWTNVQSKKKMKHSCSPHNNGKWNLLNLMNTPWKMESAEVLAWCHHS